MPAHKVLMVEPCAFYSNPLTALDNFFQNNSEDAEIQKQALKEFLFLKEQLVKAGIEVVSFQEDEKLQAPDSLFPNNWFSVHPNEFFIYPMKSENRRRERRKDIIEFIANDKIVHDWSEFENAQQFLEGTGSMVLDHENKICFASISQRTHPDLVLKWCDVTKYQPVLFHSYTENNHSIYHTNVMMFMAHPFVCICLDAITDMNEKRKVTEIIQKNKLEIISLTIEQIKSFCGNCLLLENKKGEKFLVMSENAFHHFSDEQVDIFLRHFKIIAVNISTIEKAGGGGVRCMLAELY